MVSEFSLSPSNLILPLFVKEGMAPGTKDPVRSMPGVFQHSIETLVETCIEAADLGVPAVILFGIPARKDALGSPGYDPQGIIPVAVKAIKAVLGERILVICDVCLCEYTDHGHCAPIKDDEILNDEGVDLYVKASIEYARAGCDIVAPSDMMDGRVGAIRHGLDRAGFQGIAIMSYSVKYASSFYGPFRDAAESGFHAGPRDRKTHQMDPSNLTQAYREAQLDIDEGADIIMVKPALPYLDIIKGLTASFEVPMAAYQVSGEYAMVQAAAANDWVDGHEVMMESLLSIRRAGATMILTYYALEAAKALGGSTDR